MQQEERREVATFKVDFERKKMIIWSGNIYLDCIMKKWDSYLSGRGE